MKRTIIAIGVFLLFVFGLATDVSAKDMSRRFGVGVDSTIGNYNSEGRGVSIVYNINKFFAIQAIFSIELQKADVVVENDSFYNGKYKTTITDWMVSVRGLIPFVLSSDVNLTAVVGFTANGRAADGFKADPAMAGAEKYNDGYNFSIDLGVRPEWFVSEHFSIHTQVGIAIDILTKNGTTLATALSNEKGAAIHTTNASGVHASFFSNGSLFGQAGFTFWF